MAASAGGTGLLLATAANAHAQETTQYSTLVPASDWLNIAVSGGSTSPGAPIIQWWADGGAEQKWLLPSTYTSGQTDPDDVRRAVAGNASVPPPNEMGNIGSRSSHLAPARGCAQFSAVADRRCWAGSTSSAFKEPRVSDRFRRLGPAARKTWRARVTEIGVA